MRGPLMGCLSVAVLAVACGPKTSFLTDQRQHPDYSYYFSTLSKRQGRAVERLVPPGSVVARQPKTKRDWIYIIDDPAVGTGLPRYEFQPLEKCEVVVKLQRLSDLSGRGVEAGEVRRSDTFRREFASDELHGAFSLLQSLAADPFEAVKAEAPEAWKNVAEPTQVDQTEVGFAIVAKAELVTGNPFDPAARITLYELEKRSPYQRARDAE